MSDDADIEISQCTFRVITSDPIVSPITGYVGELRVIFQSDGNITALADYSVVAGNGYVQLNEGTELKTISERRKLADATNACGGYMYVGDDPNCEYDVPLYGDVNGDCVVTIN